LTTKAPDERGWARDGGNPTLEREIAPIRRLGETSMRINPIEIRSAT